MQKLAITVLPALALGFDSHHHHHNHAHGKPAHGKAPKQAQAQAHRVAHRHVHKQARDDPAKTNLGQSVTAVQKPVMEEREMVEKDEPAMADADMAPAVGADDDNKDMKSDDMKGDDKSDDKDMKSGDANADDEENSMHDTAAMPAACKVNDAQAPKFMEIDDPCERKRCQLGHKYGFTNVFWTRLEHYTYQGDDADKGAVIPNGQEGADYYPHGCVFASPEGKMSVNMDWYLDQLATGGLEGGDMVGDHMDDQHDDDNKDKDMDDNKDKDMDDKKDMDAKDMDENKMEMEKEETARKLSNFQENLPSPTRVMAGVTSGVKNAAKAAGKAGSAMGKKKNRATESEGGRGAESEPRPGPGRVINDAAMQTCSMGPCRGDEVDSNKNPVCPGKMSGLSCGVHIHDREGTCDQWADGHYWPGNNSTEDHMADPWMRVRYGPVDRQKWEDGATTAETTRSVGVKFDEPENSVENKLIIVHRFDGTFASCGVLVRADKESMDSAGVTSVFGAMVVALVSYFMF